mgnify:FL=1
MVALGQLRSFGEGIAARAVVSRRSPRRSVLCREGLRPLRSLWWTSWGLESTAAVWRNLRLLETSPEPRTATPSFPEDALVAVYTPGHLGDILHAVPMLDAVRAARPAAKLVWIVGPWSAALARRVDGVDAIDVFSPSWHQYRRGGPGPSRIEQAAWGRHRPVADVFISTAATDLTALFIGRSHQPSWWCGRPPRVPLYPVAAREDLAAPDRDRYEAEDLLRLVEPLGVHGGSSSLRLPVQESEREGARRMVQAEGMKPGTPYAVIAPGAGWSGKQWPAERWTIVADRLQDLGVNVVLVGTGGEVPIALAVAKAMRQPPVVLAGRTNLDDLIALIAGARMWLGSDSGGLHIAAAVQTPTVALFGPTPPGKWAPPGPRHRMLRAVEGCPQCIPWHPRAVCADAASCMKAIGTDAVVAAMESLLHAGAGPAG